MSYSLELVAEKQAVVMTWHQDFSFMEEGMQFEAELRALLDSVEEPVWFIGDVRAAPITMDELLAASSAAARGEDPVFLHPNIKGRISVTKDELMKKAAEGLDSAAFNFIKSYTARTREEAFAIVAANS